MARGTSTATIARRTATIAIAAAVTAGLAACGAGQVTGTDQKQTAIAGVNIDSESGDVSLRDLQVEFESVEGYPAGAAASLRVWISNETSEPISLSGVWVGEAADQPDGLEGQVVTLVAAEDVESIGQSEAAEEPSAPEETAAEDAEEAEEETSGDQSESDEGEEAAETPDAADEPEAPALLGEAEYDIEIAAHEYVRLDRATGDVLVIENLAEPLVPGQALTITFAFSNGETVTVNVPVGQAQSQEEPSYQDNPGAGGH